PRRLPHHSTIGRPPPPSRFPYTTLFRSMPDHGRSVIKPLGKTLWRSSVAVIGAGDGSVGECVIRAAGDCYCRIRRAVAGVDSIRSEEHTSELQSRENLVCRLLLEKKNDN